MKKIIIFGIIAVVISSCFFDKKNQNVDSFYTKRIHLDFPVLPLLKPIFICYNKAYSGDEWSFEIPHYFENKPHIKNLKEIGVDRIYIYGKVNKKKWNLSDYKKGEFVYAKKYSGIAITEKPSNTKDYKQIQLIDSIKNTFIEPERWFIINVADSTTEAFFSKKKYKKYLKEKEISGEMYEINKYYKQYKKTGILPWFPDNVKEKLNK